MQEAANDESYVEKAVEEIDESIMFNPEEGYADRAMIDQMYESVSNAKSVSEIMISLIILSQNKVSKYISRNNTIVDIEKLFPVVKGRHLELVSDELIAVRIEELPDFFEEEKNVDCIAGETVETGKEIKEKHVNRFYEDLEKAVSHSDIMRAVIKLRQKGGVYTSRDRQEIVCESQLVPVKMLELSKIKDIAIVEKIHELNLDRED